MKIALLHPDSPTAEGSGAVHSATLIGEALQSLGHEVTFLCPGTVDDSYDKAATISLEVDEGLIRNRYLQINDEILAIENKLSTFDIFHSYLMRTIPAVGKISENREDLSTIVTLNAYGAVCPKNDLLYKNEVDCQSNGLTRCATCILSSKRDLPTKPDRGSIYHSGRIIHHTLKDAKNYPIISRVREYSGEIDAYQALSTHVKSKYSHFGFPNEDISVIPNILDEEFSVPHKSDFSKPLDLLYVGELKKHKGVDRLPAIIDKVNEMEDCRLSIVGKGPLEPYLRSEIENRGLEDLIDIIGFCPYNKLPNIYSLHDIFIYPGRWQEPFGRVFIESLATGTPVVSYDVGGATEIISSGGVTVEEDLDAFAEAIVGLSTDELKKYSKDGKSEVERFKKDTVVSEIDSLYKTAIQP